jgi:hypothetical protein
LNTERIDHLTGLKGKLDEKEDTYKIGFPHEVAGASDSEASVDTSSPSTLVGPVKNGGLFSSIVGPWPSSSLPKVFAKLCLTGKTLPDCKIRASASVTRQEAMI